MTNYERIKNMSIEELAAMLSFSKCQNFCIYANTNDCVERDGVLRNCKIGTMKYLESEVQEMSDKNFNEWLFSDIDDLIDCDYSDESEAETRMTDNEIIKALECCTTKGAKCSDCPAFKKVDRSDCKKYFRGAIDLINRQQEEIDELKHEREVLIEDIHCSADKINEQLEEIERLNNKISAMVVTLRNSAKATRNEAIKEFAERLKLSFFNNGYESPDVDFDYFIDNLVKEFVGKE